MIRVLMIDDEIRQSMVLKRSLAASGITVTLVSSATDVVALSKRDRFDVILLDIRLSDLHGLGLFEKLKRIEPTLGIIIHTIRKNADSAVWCMNRGAYDYLSKPCDIQTLIEVICEAARKRKINEESKPHGYLDVRLETGILIGESQAMRKVRNLIALVAPSQTPVLILGETGTGKELVAQAIHNQSTRREAPLMVVNAGALQENILESELFGYKKGAFTGAFSDKKGLLEAAHNGTCFIDEVGDMALSIQAKILRVIESGCFRKLGDTRETRVNVRFVFATNKDLALSVPEGTFREDLFYRINTFPIKCPVLMEREGDVALLAYYFLNRLSPENKLFSGTVLKLLADYHWPGNVRELANVIQRAILVSGNRKTIVVDDLPSEIIHSSIVKHAKPRHTDNWKTKLLKVQRKHAANILDFTVGNKNKAAQLSSGISRDTLSRKLKLLAT